jgi:hypothetical protein
MLHKGHCSTHRILCYTKNLQVEYCAKQRTLYYTVKTVLHKEVCITRRTLFYKRILYYIYNTVLRKNIVLH